MVATYTGEALHSLYSTLCLHEGGHHDFRVLGVLNKGPLMGALNKGPLIHVELVAEEGGKRSCTASVFKVDGGRSQS